ncbi:hypothetical protein MUK70_00170 [Dyadobacter chenwenxiniae]|uniref:Uncharacterized protein n=1 Tax=Dyadobacter chenwenxiniae TaxID=2906456 RepID=A0A9X1PRL0_9BACT|nr:hypothetical protein [Dyadobacter chenwenxiniae]MCF0063741.1 hypothetical protein [Dyadobacter chenwenxiniae]UON83416.1 hypothetical protein MUK70_00170 [Dyadobacter chenwenxiniae]
MKSILLSLSLAFLFISCKKKDNIEPDVIIDPTNELVGTTWQRTLNPDLYNYLEFKTGREVEFSSKFNGKLSIAITRPYTLDEKKVVYTSDGFNYTGTIINDTLAVMGTAGLLMIYVKIK